MKKIYFLVALLCSVTASWSQTTIFSENVGTPSGTTAIAAYTGWQNNGTLTFTDGGATAAADIRATSVSSGYTGASGAGNVFFTGTGDRGFAIENINAAAFTNLTLQFGYRKESGTALPLLAVDYWNGTSWVNLPFTFNEAASATVGWYLSPAISLPAAAQINGLKLRWMKTGTASTRVDDITFTGITGATPTLVATGTITDFGSIAVGTSSASQSFDLSGANLTGAPGNITITAPSADFEVSNNNTSWSNATTVAYATGSLAATPVYIRFSPQSSGIKSGDVTIAGGGATTVTVAVSGTGVIPVPATPVATAATGIGSTGFTANWNAAANVTGYRLDVYTLTTGSVVTDIAGWNFATSSAAAQTADLGNANNVGIQTVTSSGLNVISWPSGPSGATGTPNPFSVSANGWDNGDGVKYWQIDVNTTGASNITLSSLQGSSGTGPSAFKVQYKIGAGGTWADVAGGTVTLTTPVAAGNLTTWGAVTDLALPAAADNQPLVSIRWISTSNTSVNNGVVAATGTSRISAIYVKGNTSAQLPSYVAGYQDLSVGNVTSYPVTGLNPNTTYYYVVRAENAGGTSANSNQEQVTTTAGVLPVITASALTSFGNTCINTTAAGSFTLTGTNLTAADVTVAALAGYSVATTAGGPYTPTLTINQPGGAFSQTIFVNFTPTAVQSYNGDIVAAGGGATAINIAATGAGVDAAPVVTSGAATAITNTSATVAGTISDPGCSTISAYGIEYSTTSGFANGTGTQVPATNLAGTQFSSALAALTAGTTYYFKAYATNAAGTSYGAEQSFTTGAPTAPVAPVATAATFVTGTGFTANWNAVAGATNYRLDVYTMAAGGVTDIAGWNFATNTAAAQTADLGNANNVGIQTVSSSGLNVISWPAGPSGTSGTPNPYSVSANGWDNGDGIKYWQIDVNTTGASNITLSSLQGSSNTGPSAFKVQYKIGAAGTWADVAGGTVTLTTAVAPANLATWGAISNLALPAAADNQPLVSIRWISTSNTSVNNGVVAAGGTSRISAIYVKGNSGSGSTPVYVSGYQDLSVGNVTSYPVTGLTAGITYHYVVRAENAGGTSANSNDISVTTIIPVTPNITTTSLADFGSVCVNTASTVNSFTISGTNLTNANITVGPLAGFSFATVAGGPFTPTLTLTQPGGTYSQQVFVSFNPVAVQSYNGNIPVAGGGTTTAVNVAATGSGVNTAPSVTTGAATGVTNNAAVLAGNIPSIGCTPVTAYGVEYSTTSGFANGTGTQVAGSNLTAGNFTVAVSALTNSTTYYYKAYATNTAGTAYGTEQSFTTLATAPAVLSATALQPFGNVCAGTGMGSSFTVTGTNLTAATVTIGALPGYSYATTATGSYTSTLTLTPAAGSINQVVYVWFNPSAAQSYNGNIPVTGGGATAINVAASGSGVNTLPTLVTDAAQNITTNSAVAGGTVNDAGCSYISDYGVEYSGIDNFTPGTGTKASGGSGITSGNFSVQLSSLVQGVTYYYRAYARNNGGVAYGAQQSFTVAAIPNGLTLYPVPVRKGGTLNFSMNNMKQGYAGVELYNAAGQQVYRKHFNIQGNFINDRIVIPFGLPAGIYSIRIINDREVLETRKLLIAD